MPPSTIPSTSSAISSPGRRFGSSDQRRRRNGATRPPRHDDSPRSGIPARTPQLHSAATTPTGGLTRHAKVEPTPSMADVVRLQLPDLGSRLAPRVAYAPPRTRGLL